MDSKNNRFSFTGIIEELQSKFDRVFEYVQSLKDENENLKMKVASLEREIDELRRENEELKKNGVVLLSEKEREELKKKLSFLIEKIDQYL